MSLLVTQRATGNDDECHRRQDLEPPRVSLTWLANPIRGAVEAEWAEGGRPVLWPEQRDLGHIPPPMEPGREPEATRLETQEAEEQPNWLRRSSPSCCAAPAIC